MSSSSTSPPGELFRLWRSGDDEALHRLLPLVYEELRRVARRHLRGERPDHTLQTTALINEAYLRLMDQEAAEVRDRCHFVALTSRLMRQILVDHARARLARKRDGGCRITLAEHLAVAEPGEVDVLAVDEALNRLGALDPQQARIVELRYFGGLSIRETAEVLDVSEATVKRDWATARAWLHREIERAPGA
ncbi:MAG: sigma-70 family RNA polymerase sigma factor [Gammaproteobacteria bacterium]|nr:sigma-70 family RNA polymerase sigma factor [Gammaproteobacteria bacterium]